MTAVLAAMRSDLVAALKAGDATRTSAIRVALAAVANAEAVDPATVVSIDGEAPRRELTEADVVALLAAERDDLREQAAALRSRGQVDAALELDARATVVAAYLTDESVALPTLDLHEHREQP